LIGVFHSAALLFIEYDPYLQGIGFKFYAIIYEVSFEMDLNSQKNNCRIG